MMPYGRFLSQASARGKPADRSTAGASNASVGVDVGSLMTATPGCICEREIIKPPSQLLLLKTSISPTASFTVLGR